MMAVVVRDTGDAPVAVVPHVTAQQRPNSIRLTSFSWHAIRFLQ
jgi:hypothetical protein